MHARSEAAPAATAPGAHALAAADVLAAQRTDERRGLDAAEVARRRAAHGWNELSRARPVPAWRRLLRQFRDVLVCLLLVAAGVSLLLHEWLDAVAILAIVALNAGLGFMHEERVARAIEALRALAQPRARVLREGRVEAVEARDLVPGDVIQVEAGEAVPADARLLGAVAFRTQEAALTGESTPVDKEAGAPLPPITALGDRSNCIWLGTLAVAGHATAVVVATGMQTELGAIAGLMQDHAPRPTPLQERLAAVGRLLGLTCVLLVALIAGLHLLRGAPFGEVFVFAIGLSVAAVPEGLPAVVTVALALGMRRLLARQALVRKLPCVETLGSVTVICTDKTGTLTRNEMTVREVRTVTATFAFDGSGYAPHGEIRGTGAAGADDPDLRTALTIGRRCNNATLVAPSTTGAPWTIIGDPTEGALVVAAAKAGLAAAPAGEPPLLFEVPFDSDRRMMSVAVGGAAGAAIYCKGAVEVVLERCTRVLRAGRIEPLDAATARAILADGAAMAASALRVLALAMREGDGSDQPIEQDLVFVALAGMQDPPREQVPDAVRTCQRAGIRAVMITGDHPDTGLAIAREIGLAGAADRAVSGVELDTWSDAELAGRLPACRVFARVSAEHKLRIVRALRAAGEIVAMTGDGINDVPALQEADIGIAMGRSGTDVARQAADMVLLDDDFASIVAAVREGRGIFDNIRRFVHYLLTANLAEVLVMLYAALAGLPPPLTAAQLLWINLVTDGLPALSLGMEPTERDVMERPPRPSRSAVVSRIDAVHIGRRGLLAAVVVAVALAASSGPEHGNALAFAILVFLQLGLVFAFRSETRTLFELGPFSNRKLLGAVVLAALLQFAVQTVPALRTLLSVAPLTPGDWLLALAASLLPVTVVETGKLLRRAAARRRAP